MKKQKRSKQLSGTDQSRGFSPILPKPAGRLTVTAARFAIFFTILAWGIYLVEQSVRLTNNYITPRSLIETAVYLIIVTILAASSLAYLFSRLGYFERIKTHHRVPRSIIEDYFDKTRPRLTVLVPSYREEERIIRHTLLSAALQEYPHLRVVLLIDDPPDPDNIEHQRLLERSRGLIELLSDQFREPCRKFNKALAIYDQQKTEEKIADAATLTLLATHYDDAAHWFKQEGIKIKRTDHIDEFFAIELFGRMAKDLQITAQALRAAANDPGTRISRRRVRHLYTRIVNMFQVEFSSFERKRFATLSHEPNKAMNLNSYLGLMGGRYCIVPSPGGSVLIPAGDQQPDLVVPDCDYVLTLDADSILLPEYCLRLIYFMEQQENANVAVAQTPYSAYRGSTSRIERIAGATTDIQHIAHQGLPKHGATFWVGANAVIRKLALADLEQTQNKAGFVIRRFINDRTVIEDTESSIDLRSRGWKLYNYPERLSYSATPSNFGSLVIQRQRWANGGLVILPALLRLFGRAKNKAQRIAPSELLLRIHYLASIAWTSFGIFILFFFPFEDGLLTRAAIFTALPYFWAMMCDLRRAGYRRRDVFQIYGFNLLLLPVNIAGTIQSIVQIIGGQKVPFARTPKIQTRTVAPLRFLLIPLMLIAWSFWTLRNDMGAALMKQV